MASCNVTSLQGHTGTIRNWSADAMVMQEVRVKPQHRAEMARRAGMHIEWGELEQGVLEEMIN